MTAEPADHDASYEVNRRLWDAWTAIHATGDFYDLEGFRKGGIRLRDEEVEALGDVRGRTLLHLQCHFGIDTLSWARLGATVTGADDQTVTHTKRVLALPAAVLGLQVPRY